MIVLIKNLYRNVKVCIDKDAEVGVDVDVDVATSASICLI